MRLSEKLSELTSCGYTVQYAIPSEAHDNGWVLSHRVSKYAVCDADRPFVEISDARDECYYGQSSFIDRSNFRSLERDFPGVFVRVSYTNVNALGFFPHSASDDVIKVMCHLTDYALYDESDLSELEHDEITESWDRYLWWDTKRELPEWWQDLADTFTESEIEAAFWSALSESDYYPECAGGEVLWDYAEIQEVIIGVLRGLRRAQLGRV